MPVPATTASAPATSSRSIQERAAAFRDSSTGRATLQMVTTLVPLSAAFALMFWGPSHAWWLTVLMLPVTAGLFVRTFIIMHDCGHGSFTSSRRANEIIGFIPAPSSSLFASGAATMRSTTPRRRLDRRGHGTSTR